MQTVMPGFQRYIHLPDLPLVTSLWTNQRLKDMDRGSILGFRVRFHEVQEDMTGTTPYTAQRKTRTRRSKYKRSAVRYGSS